MKHSCQQVGTKGNENMHSTLDTLHLTLFYVKRGWLVLLLFFSMLSAATASEKLLFGPVKYEVKERYGAENRYTADFSATEGLYAVRLKNGDTLTERPDFLEFSLNGEKILKEAKYEHPVIVLFARLKKQNSFELVLKDARPSGLKRPPPVPKFTYISVLPAPVSGIEGAFGAGTWEAAIAYANLIRGIKNTQAQLLAATAAGLQNELSVRTEALRSLSDMKEPAAIDFIRHIFKDVLDKPEVRAEAALAIAAFKDVKDIPLLINELTNYHETIRVAVARGLSFYEEDDTAGPLKRLLERLDPMRRTALMRALSEAGWKPTGVLVEMAGSKDVYIANAAIEILGGLRDRRATDLLLELIENPGQNDQKVIIRSLGMSGDERAVDALIRMAKDPSRRAGKELEIANALLALGDKRGGDAIGVMIKNAPNDRVKYRLMEAYYKLTGKAF